MKLSVAMIVKNEEKNLKKSLGALQCLDGKLDYEIIVVDTGSDDNTVEVAKGFTDKVYEYEWNNDFASMRNISLSYCTGDWILVLDADEILENPECLIEVLSTDYLSGFKAASVGFKNFVDDNYVFGSIVRLFKNNEGIEYKGIVHEQLVNYGLSTKTEISFLHYGYSRDDYELMEYKYERNKELILDQLKKAKGNERIYPLFQLAKTYSMANKQREAFQKIEEAYNLMKMRTDGLINTYVIHFYAQSLFDKKNYEEAIKKSKEGIIYSKKMLDYYYIIALSYLDLKKFDEAEEYIEKFIRIRKNRNESEYEDNSLTESTYNKLDEMLKCKAICNYEQKNYSKVIKTYREIEDSRVREGLEEGYLYCLAKLEKVEDIIEFFKEKGLQDEDLLIMINIINRLEMEESSQKIIKFVKKIVILDKRLEAYLKLTYFNEIIEDCKNIKFEKFAVWKGTIFSKLVDEGIIDIEFLKKMSIEDMELYVRSISGNYNCLKKLYEYSEEKFLSENIEELILLTTIEKVLLCSNSIEEEKYENLCKRTIVNRLNFINLLYKEEFVNSAQIIKVLSDYDRLIVNLKKIIKLYSSDRIAHIKGLKELLINMPQYKNVIKMFLGKINNNPISDEMLKEKENLYKVIEKLLNENKTNKALEIIKSLSEIFIYDEKLLSYKGIALYMLGKNDEALVDLSMAKELTNKKFEPTYNIACILESIDKKQYAKHYYKKSLLLCEEENMKNEILNIVESM